MTKAWKAHHETYQGIDFHALCQAIPFSYLILSPDLKIIDASDAYQAMTFYERQSLIGCSFLDIVKDADEPHGRNIADILGQSLKKVLASREPDTLALCCYDFTFSARKAQNLPRNWRITHYPLMNNEQGIYAILHCVEDASAVIDLENRLRQSEEEHAATCRRLETEVFLKIEEIKDNNRKLIEANSEALHLMAAIVESSDDAIISKSTDGIITSWNSSAERMFGYSAAEAIGQHITLITPSEKHEDELEIHQKTLKGEHIRNHETIRLHKDGSHVPVSATTHPIHDDTGAIIGISKIDRNIRNIKESEQQLKRTLEKLMDSNTELERFAYICSHDLQEPLRMISNFTQRLQKHIGENADEKTLHYMEYIVNGALNARTLINDVLSLARIEQGTRMLEKVDCNEVLETVLQSLDERIRESSACVTNTELPVVLGHRIYIIQIFQNLISNALKFCSIRTPNIHIEAHRQGDFWQFFVQDNGIGIEPQYREKVFQIFHRLHSRDKYAGTGIGLAIVKKIVELYHGSIWLESVYGQGTTFFFTLPIFPETKEQ